MIKPKTIARVLEEAGALLDWIRPRGSASCVSFEELYDAACKLAKQLEELEAKMVKHDNRRNPPKFPFC